MDIGDNALELTDWGGGWPCSEGGPQFNAPVVPTTGALNSSASLERSIQGGWRGGFVEKWNLKFRSSIVVFVLAVEEWNNST